MSWPESIRKIAALQQVGIWDIFRKGRWSREFEAVAFSLPGWFGLRARRGTAFGYHLIKVEEEKRAAKKLRYDDIKMDLAGYVFIRRKCAIDMRDFVGDLRKKADVKGANPISTKLKTEKG